MKNPLIYCATTKDSHPTTSTPRLSKSFFGQQSRVRKVSPQEDKSNSQTVTSYHLMQYESFKTASLRNTSAYWEKTRGIFVVLKFGQKMSMSSQQSLTGSLHDRITYREIPVVITGNRYAEYNFCLFRLYNFPVLAKLKMLL